ncbi:arginine-glutamic acid dipeptide repeats protein-like [Leguminivora glycinivorella]|uniref:arginine-glutamic acid dipeptide repeats protein-like n=1 Tax=Leguminivora glycinivorella TaxID=1035111 RepID=UPI00200BA618|nr:arginine-glutamic acid dipeptide repeats protein-like [Leguminivora glycinivorella]
MAKKRSKAKSAKPTLAVESPVTVTKTPGVDTINTEEAIAAALSSVAQPVLMKVCRLCETKDGPFLNIFDPETLTAKKTQELMPFVIAEYDDLPHKICFRCSAKVEELHEFVQRCIRTQENLRKALGRSGPKTQTSKLWEEKLHKSNISNDAICDALIKKAMAGIEDLPLNCLTPDEIQNKNNKTDSAQKDDDDDESDLPLNKVKKETSLGLRSTRQEQLENKNDKPVGNQSLDAQKNKRATRVSESLNNQMSTIELQSDDDEPLQTRNSIKKSKINQNKPHAEVKKNKSSEDDSDNNIKIKQPEQINQESVKTASAKEKDFDIMDHISMIKVNGVGVLFQCKLCNRNFLKKEVVVSHACAKTGVPKIDFTTNLAPIPDPPKVTTVKYINTRIDGEIRKPAPSPTVVPPAASAPEVKSKPKIGPASKIKRPIVGMVVTPREPSPPAPQPTPVTAMPAMPAVEFPAAPNLKSRYKLVPGPNNTFTLMEDVDRDIPAPRILQKPGPPIDTRPKLTPVKPSEVPQQVVKNVLNHHYQSQVINLDDAEEITPHVSGAPPYPVGLFSTVSHTSNILPPPVVPQPAPFTTPAMKKQSYTIVKTGNPSKLLISTKVQPPVEEPPKKKQRKSKLVPNAEPMPPFNASSDDPTRSKDNFFTFINVDPLLQPSYVLPTDNIIQESQISTSTPLTNAPKADANVYSCNMCPEKFSREKKLLSHIQSHYSKMDEEDQQREKTGKRRGRSSNTNK